MSTTSIEWAQNSDGTPGQTWNPIAGCTPVSPGCLNCYAATMSYRLERMRNPKYQGLTVLHNGVRTFNGTISFDHEALTIPLERKKPTTYFVNSMSDLFHEDVPFDFVDRVFAVMALCPQHTFQVLTKRPERMAEYLNGIEHFDNDLSGADGGHRLGSAAGCLLDGIWIWGAGKPNRKIIENFISDTHDESGDDGDPDIDPECFYQPKPVPWPLRNVWLGCSPANQKTFDEYMPHIIRVPAAVRFLSIEPLLGPIKLGDLTGIDWVIVGGESGSGARPCDLAWIHSIVRQCKAADVPVFVKQLGSKPENTDPDLRCGGVTDKKGGDITEFPEDLRVRQFPTNHAADVAKMVAP